MSFRFDASEIAAATSGTVVADAPAGTICTDTRAVTAGCWFVALRGERFDAHDFLQKARDAGAGGAVVDRDVPGWDRGLVRVPDTLAAIQDLGRAARARIGHPVVGLTGSAGKTTTRAFVACALAPLGRIHQTVGNLNNHLGVPFTLLATPEDAAASVVELGTSGPGEIELLSEISQPDVRLIVNVGAAHLEELGGLDGVAFEKGSLFRMARPGDTVCVNVDDPRIVSIPVPAGVRVIRYGLGEDADIRLVSAALDADTLSTDAIYESSQGAVRVRIPAPGAHLAHNAAGALAVAFALGVPLADAAAGLAGYEPVGMRMRAEPLPNGATALNDAYNANPTSVEASLRLLASLPGRRAAVLGDMLELGTEEERLHREVAALAGELGLDLVVLVGPRMAAAADACPGALVIPDADHAPALGENLRAWLRPGDRMLFKGSRGARVERILQSVRGDAVDATDGGHR